MNTLPTGHGYQSSATDGRAPEQPRSGAALRAACAEAGAELVRRVRRQWALLEVGASVVGSFVVLAFLHELHSAQNPSHSPHQALIGVAELIAYLAIALPLGWTWRVRRTGALWRWLAEDRPAGPAERDLILHEPQRELIVPATLWGVAAVLFGTLDALTSRHYAWNSALTIALGGLTTCALIYLGAERLLRPVTARALASRPPIEPVGPGVAIRLITGWGLASGVPMLGAALIAASALNGEIKGVNGLATAVLILAGAGLAVGATAVVLSARSLAEPLSAVRRALARVRAGDLNVHVEVNDGSEVGLLQAGFNEMAQGLRDRERMRDLFGRHVGEDVARRALADGVALGGEVREVAGLFVDLVGSTTLASRRAPEEVVSLLNRFFSVVVDVIGSHGGWVSRFEGDGALCVFGAPTAQLDAAGRALAAARTLSQCLGDELPELDMGIGISAGPAVAGNVGAERRLEYTVIGDPINEAARLCELAKHQPGRVLASGAALQRASLGEAIHWQVGKHVTLRGRTEPTRLATPISDVATAAHAGSAR